MLFGKYGKRIRFGWRDAGINVAVFAALIGLWELVVKGLDISENVFPSAGSVASYLAANIGDGTFIKHFRVTFIETFAGFLIGSAGGMALGVLVAEMYWARKLVYPFILALQSVPAVTFAPLFLIWFGFGISSKIALAVAIVFFPVLVNTVTGLSYADRARVNMLRAYAAPRRQIFLRVKLPDALPYIFAGLEIAVVLSVIAAVIAEFIGSRSGLGYLIIVYNNQLNLPAQFSVLILLGVIGAVLKFAIHKLGDKLIFWQDRQPKKIGM